MDESALRQAQCQGLKFEILAQNKHGNVLRLESRGQHVEKAYDDGDGEDTSFDAVW
eukprot:CAMPEP_0117080704 /NCGR_PEP_ID=MMETSP0472-20121206/56927_1 /TAXON_ID=693140 ORGANISM="Tiarina fusus, Strain LIS" /NCGR_SAMPLE_ID=MMETSP0472 /ASSEMBLY_ACC=CAM_ASM_000603 /LENGTH=55 /DNA_ID=CAMNT_0004808425 /DNA_START=94 /DNA_END=258 /DNA_ORIENTATION=-